jgi:transcription antitermination factor NusB
MNKRRRARILALQVLFSKDLNPDGEDFDISWLKKGVEQDIQEFSRCLVQGTLGAVDEIDPLIKDSLENWQFDRLAVVDRNILRLATFELLRCPEIPPAVSINEAVELAKLFSTEDSPSFVNAVLDRIRKVLRSKEIKVQEEERGI